MLKRAGYCLWTWAWVLLAGPLAANAQVPVPEPGPHGVGFRTIDRYDRSRTFRPKRDYLGTVQEGERARPVQVCVWYPARTEASDPRMVYGEFVYAHPAHDGLIRHLAYLQARELQSIGHLLYGHDGLMMDLMNRPSTAVRDAEPADGRFPLLLYATQFGRSPSENAALLEYLASWGFVVAAPHSCGAFDVSVLRDARDLDAQVRDLEFGIACLRDDPRVDPDALGVLGRGYGTLAALLLQMRNTDIDAVATLGGAMVTSGGLDLIGQSPYFDIRQARAPILQAYVLPDESFDRGLIDSLRYAPRHLLALAEVGPVIFSAVSVAAQTLLDRSEFDLPRVASAHAQLCGGLHAFFHENLKNSDGAHLAGVTTMMAEDMPPTEGQFVSIVRNHGVRAAEETYSRFRDLDPPPVMFREAVMNGLGYEFLMRGQADEAVTLFTLNAEAYPASANAWDSLSEAHLAAGNQGRALECVRKVLEVLPTDASLTDALRSQLATLATERLQDLTPDVQ